MSYLELNNGLGWNFTAITYFWFIKQKNENLNKQVLGRGGKKVLLYLTLKKKLFL